MVVADRFEAGPLEAGRRPASNLSATSFEPDSVMEFGFNHESSGLTGQVGWLGLRVGGHLALSLHSSTEHGELPQ